MTRNDALREARIQRHWTQSTLAAQLNTTRVTVVRWEQGKASPSLYFREQLCQLFGMTEQALGLSQSPTEMIPQPVWLVPRRRNCFFTGREEILRQLYADEEVVPSGIHIISGLAGIGKTQVALEYAYRFRQHYTVIAWLRAETPATLLEDVSRLARALHLLDVHEPEPTHLVGALKVWLETHSDWLLIFDHVEDLAQLSHILPADHVRGKVLVTTRLQATGYFSHVPLKEMSNAESVLLLLHRAKLLPISCHAVQAHSEEQSLAAQLCHMLGGLPLAIDQAGAYIEETGCSVAGYLKRFQSRRTALLSWHSQQSSSSVVATVRSVRECVERQSLVAGELLSLCLFLDPETIPEVVITSSTMYLGEHIQQAVHDLLRLDEAFAILSASSLLWRDPETHLLRMHRFIQTVLRDQLDAEQQCLWVGRALQALLHLFPANPHHEVAAWPLCDLLLPHIICCIEHIEGLVWSEQQNQLAVQGITMLLDALDYLCERARYQEAETFLAHIHNLLAMSQGMEYPLVSYLPHKYVLPCKALGECSQAEERSSRVFRLWEQAPSESCPVLKRQSDLSVSVTA